MSVSTNPSYNIKVVLRETGLKADALRIWEKRYGLPDPARSSGGHRLYSEYDIELIKWLLKRKAEGLSISKAVQLFKDLETEGKNPVITQAVDDQSVVSFSGKQLEEIRSEFVEACCEFNESKAEALLSHAFALYPAESVGVEVMQKSLTDIGAAWFENELTVAQEHFASNLIIRRLSAILAAAPAPFRHEVVLVANPAKEHHVFSGLMIALMLRNRGWHVIQLGANVPTEELLKAANKTKPDAVVLIAMQLLSAANLLDSAIQLGQVNIPVGFGGLAFQRFPQLKDQIPGFYLGGNLGAAAEEIESLVQSSPKSRNAAINPFDKLGQVFLKQRGIIEADVLEGFKGPDSAKAFIHVANEQLGNDIWAALRLGNLNYIDQDIEWVQELLAKRGLPYPALATYLKHYQAAVETHLGSKAKDLKDWLDIAAQRVDTNI